MKIDAEDEAVSLDRIVMALEPAKRLRLVILDACRDNCGAWFYSGPCLVEAEKFQAFRS
jgi:hypothetical protein